jgi:hypothetical protein
MCAACSDHLTSPYKPNMCQPQGTPLRGGGARRHVHIPQEGMVTRMRADGQRPLLTSCSVAELPHPPLTAPIYPTATSLPFAAGQALALVPSASRPFVPFRARSFCSQSQRQQVANRLLGLYLTLLLRELRVPPALQTQVRWTLTIENCIITHTTRHCEHRVHHPCFFQPS